MVESRYPSRGRASSWPRDCSPELVCVEDTSRCNIRVHTPSVCKKLAKPPGQHRSRHSSPEPSLAVVPVLLVPMPLPSVADQGWLELLLQEQLYKTPAHPHRVPDPGNCVQQSPTTIVSFFPLPRG